jgi:hypothetical protein
MDDYCRPFRASNGATPQVDKFHRGGLLKRKFHIMLTEALQLGPVKVMEVLPLIASTDVSYRSGDTLSPLRKNRNRLTTYEGNKPDSLCSCATILESAAVQYCPRFWEDSGELSDHRDTLSFKRVCVGQLYLSRLQMQEEVFLYWALSSSPTCPNSHKLPDLCCAAL